LPERIRALFWDSDASGLTLGEHADFIYGRVLGRGGLADWRWLRERVGDAALREWLLRTRGRPLSPKQLRLWELLLDLPHDVVSGWIADPRRAIWDGRAA
jgi:hypothetical protein